MRQDDPVVERVRAARRAIVNRCGQTSHRVYEWAKQIESQNRDRVVGYEEPQKRGHLPDGTVGEESRGTGG